MYRPVYLRTPGQVQRRGHSPYNAVLYLIPEYKARRVSLLGSPHFRLSPCNGFRFFFRLFRLFQFFALLPSSECAICCQQQRQHLCGQYGSRRCASPRHTTATTTLGFFSRFFVEAFASSGAVWIGSTVDGEPLVSYSQRGRGLDGGRRAFMFAVRLTRCGARGCLHTFAKYTILFTYNYRLAFRSRWQTGRNDERARAQRYPEVGRRRGIHAGTILRGMKKAC